MRLIAIDGNGSDIHFHGAHIESAYGVEMLQDASANGVVVARLLPATARKKGGGKPGCEHKMLHARILCNSTETVHSVILRGLKSIGNHWQIVETNAGGVKNGIADGRRHGHDRRLAGAGGRNIFTIQQDGFDFRHVAEARHAIARETRILDAPVFKFDGFKERPAEPLNHRANHLVAQSIRVDDSAALERFDKPDYADSARLLAYHNFRAGRHVTALLIAAREPESLPFLRFLAWPAKGLRRSLQHRAEAGIGKILHAKVERVHLGSTRECIHVRFACEVIRRRSKPAIGTAPQDQRHGMVFRSLIRNVVGSLDSGRTRMVVVEFPGSQRAVTGDAAFDFDDTGGTEIRPGEFFLSSPYHFHGTPGGTGQPSSFDGSVAGVLASIGRASVRYNHAHAALGKME